MADDHECPDCDQSFPTTQQLGAHRYRAHGYRSPESLRRQRLGLAPRSGKKRGGKRAAAKPVPPPQVASPTISGLAGQVQNNLDAMAASLTEQLAQVEQRLAEIDAEQKQLRHLRTEIGATVKRLSGADTNGDQPAAQAPRPNQGVIDGNRRRAAAQLERKTQAVERLLTTNRAAWADGFTSNQLADHLRTQVPGGLSPKSARQVLDRLRESGVVRHDRVVKGGGMQFKLVGGSEHDQPAAAPVLP